MEAAQAPDLPRLRPSRFPFSHPHLPETPLVSYTRSVIIIAAVKCPEHQRLVAEHLRIISGWKKLFDKESTEAEAAWAKALEAELAVFEHDQSHGCSARFQLSDTPDASVPRRRRAK